LVRREKTGEEMSITPRFQSTRHLDATDLTPDILTWLSWRWGHLGAKY